MCVFVLNLTRPVVAGKAVIKQPCASEMEDLKSDIVDSEATNLSAETFSKSIDVSSWSDVSEVPKKTMVSTGCGTSSVRTQLVGSEKEAIHNDKQKADNVYQNEDVKEKKLVSTSTGTSPPPQSISTQVSFQLRMNLSKIKINRI